MSDSPTLVDFGKTLFVGAGTFGFALIVVVVLLVVLGDPNRSHKERVDDHTKTILKYTRPFVFVLFLYQLGQLIAWSITGR